MSQKENTKKTAKSRITEVTPYQKSKQVKVKRSQIKFADYNPQVVTEKVLNEIKKNFKAVGLLGGLVVNKKTMRVVSGHKRIMTLDMLHKYDPKTKENDYSLLVEMVELTEKQEKEQNIFMNNKTVQGEFDMEKLGALLPEIDYKAAGLDDFDVNQIMAEAPQFFDDDSDEAVEDIQDDMGEMDEPYESKKEAVKAAKEAQKEAAFDKFEDDQDPYFSVAFDNFENKAEFMNLLGFDAGLKFVKGEEMLDKIQNL